MQDRQCTQSGSQPSPLTSSANPNPGLLGLKEGEGEQADPLDTVPNEQTGATETLAQGEEANELALSRGQYRVSFTVPGTPSAKTARTATGQTERVRVGDEMKRVHFYKVDAVPTEETSDDGEKLTRVTAVFHVVDNPLPLVPIAWGAAALVGVGGGGWLLFSSAEEFVQKTQWPILTGAAAILSVLVGYHQLFG